MQETASDSPPFFTESASFASSTAGWTLSLLVLHPMFPLFRFSGLSLRAFGRVLHTVKKRMYQSASSRYRMAFLDNGTRAAM